METIRGRDVKGNDAWQRQQRVLKLQTHQSASRKLFPSSSGEPGVNYCNGKACVHTDHLLIATLKPLVGDFCLHLASLTRQNSLALICSPDIQPTLLA